MRSPLSDTHLECHKGWNQGLHVYILLDMPSFISPGAFPPKTPPDSHVTGQVAK